MNGSRAANAALLTGILEGLGNAEAQVAVCVPAPYLFQCEEILKGSPVAWGAQDVSCHPVGAYTGEVCMSMLQDFGSRYVIVGHSERRAYHGETNELVAKKTKAALEAGLTPIVCIGETLVQREAGQTMDVVSSQLEAVLEAVGSEAVDKIVLAYEPVWAIGTGKTATPDQAQEVHAFIRERYAALCDKTVANLTRILYGGSVKPDNVDSLMAQPDVDGLLVGGASLEVGSFKRIIRFVSP